MLTIDTSNVRKNETETSNYERVASANGYGVILNKQGWEEFKNFVDVSFSRLEGKEKVDVKVNFFDPSPLRKDLEEIKEKLADFLDDVDDVHDSQQASLEQLASRVRSLEVKANALASKVSGLTHFNTRIDREPSVLWRSILEAAKGVQQ
jgi:hypothetical protein